jgi:hypothetical protein
VYPVQIDETCAACKQGQMRPTGRASMTAPPQYEHRCTHCGHVAMYSTRFPYVEYRPEQ